MAVVLVGVGADSGNVDPVPALLDGRRFEYVPIPEKSTETTETKTLGSMPQRHGDGPLSALVDGIRPGSEGDWIRGEERIRTHPVHHDPNFEALTYGEGGKDSNINAIVDHLEAGDVLGFYTGLETAGRLHRYLFGYFTLATDPVVLDAETPAETRAAVLEEHHENAHAKRFAERGELYALDPDQPQGASRVVLADGCEPGGLLDRAVRLSGPVDRGNYYMAEEVAEKLDPNTTYLGGFKPAIRCEIPASAFVDFVDSRQ
jgi:hypothetical protein